MIQHREEETKMARWLCLPLWSGSCPASGRAQRDDKQDCTVLAEEGETKGDGGLGQQGGFDG